MTEITSRLSTALADRYRIERHLGEGGMATVYLAEDLKHKRKVAVNLALVTLLSGVFDSSIRPPWLLASGTYLGWLVAMGVVLLRLKEPVVPEGAKS